MHTLNFNVAYRSSILDALFVVPVSCECFVFSTRGGKGNHSKQRYLKLLSSTIEVIIFLEGETFSLEAFFSSMVHHGFICH